MSEGYPLMYGNNRDPYYMYFTMNTRDINSLIDVLEEYEDDMKIQVFSILTSLWSCEDVSKEERSTAMHMFTIVRFDSQASHAFVLW